MEKTKQITLTINGIINYQMFEGLNIGELEMIQQVAEVALLRAKGESEAAYKLIEKQIQERIERRSTI